MHVWKSPLWDFPSHFGHHRALSRVPCAIERVLISSFPIQLCTFVNSHLPAHPTPLSHFGIHRFVLYVCVSVSPLPRAVPFFQQPHGEHCGGFFKNYSTNMLLLLSRFSCVRRCATPQTAAHQAPLSWDSPGRGTGVGCHFLLQCMKVKSESEAAQSCPTPSNPMDCSLPGSSVYGIFQAKVLEWGAIAFSIALPYNPAITLLGMCLEKTIWNPKDTCTTMFEIENESHSVMFDSATPCTIQSMEFSRPEYRSG